MDPLIHLFDSAYALNVACVRSGEGFFFKRELDCCR